MAYERLAKLSGVQFDREYVKVMVQDHDKTVAQFEEASFKVKDPPLKAFIEKTVPTLRQHKEHVHGLQLAGFSAKECRWVKPKLFCQDGCDRWTAQVRLYGEGLRTHYLTF